MFVFLKENQTRNPRCFHGGLLTVVFHLRKRNEFATYNTEMTYILTALGLSFKKTKPVTRDAFVGDHERLSFLLENATNLPHYNT